MQHPSGQMTDSITHGQPEWNTKEKHKFDWVIELLESNCEHKGPHKRPFDVV